MVHEEGAAILCTSWFGNRSADETGGLREKRNNPFLQPFFSNAYKAMTFKMEVGWFEVEPFLYTDARTIEQRQKRTILHPSLT
jgi:hypothetical protein